MRLAVMTSRIRITVLYDESCGFCSMCARVLRRLDRAGRLRLMPLQVASDRLAGGPSMRELTETMHSVDASGRWETGADAWVRIAAVVPVLRPLGILGR